MFSTMAQTPAAFIIKKIQDIKGLESDSDVSLFPVRLHQVINVVP
jgi:hypothetical protein